MQHTYAPGDEEYDEKLESIINKETRMCEMDIKDVTVIYDPSLMACSHDYSCPICREEHGVISRGIMQPCWGCQAEGWEVRQRDDRNFCQKFFSLK